MHAARLGDAPGDADVHDRIVRAAPPAPSHRTHRATALPPPPRSYNVAFLYIFAAASLAARELDAARPGSRGAHHFGWARLLFLIAILCWVVDILGCRRLWSLPLGLPYPQLHGAAEPQPRPRRPVPDRRRLTSLSLRAALGWHCGTCVGLHHLFALLVAHERAVIMPGTDGALPPSKRD